MNLADIRQRIVTAVHSSRGHDLFVLLIFVAISALLWCVMSVNDEAQRDFRMPVRITNVPDSVTFVSVPPQYVSVNVRARGSQLMKINWGKIASLDIDWRRYRVGNTVRLGMSDLKAAVGASLDVIAVNLVYPDSLNLYFTSSKPTLLPVIADYRVTTGVQFALDGTPELLTDTVKVYSLELLPGPIQHLTTEPINIEGLSENLTKRVKIIAPAGSRAIPDSVDIRFKVQPMILKVRKVLIEPINVPESIKLITFPAYVNVSYMISVSDYKTAEPRIRVVADYNTINEADPTRNIRLKLTEVSSNLQNVQLASDSAEFIIERL